MARFAKLRMDARGGAIAAWRSPRGVEAAAFEPGRGWSPPQTQGVPPQDPDPHLFPVTSHDLGVDDLGQARVVWVRDGRIFAGTFSNAGAWGASTPIQATSQWACCARIAVNGAGEAFATWIEIHLDGYEIWSARFVP
jgi:hypothetical protein